MGGVFIIIAKNKILHSVFNYKTKEKQIQINTTDLPKGNYILKIIYGDSVMHKQVLIEK